MQCPKCNKEINDNVKFCKYCGIKIENVNLKMKNFDSIHIESPPFIICSSCGKEMQDQKAFCTNCGNQLKGASEKEEISSKKNENRPKRKSLKVIIVCVVLSLIIGSSVIAMRYFAKSNIGKFDKVVEKTNEDEVEREEDKEGSLNENEKDSSEEDKKDENIDEKKEVNLEPDVELEEMEETGVEIEQIDLVEEISMSKIQTISSSSELSEYNMIHRVDRIVDENITTAWVEGITGQGIGEYILFEFDGIYSVKGFDIYAGYQKNYSLYEKNSRPKELILEFGDGTEEIYVLGDLMEKQSIVFGDIKITDYIKIIIKEVYAGSKYEDTVISEICFY